MHQKGESFEEIYSFIKYLKSKSLKLNLKGNFLDTCGTGGDSKIALISQLQPQFFLLHLTSKSLNMEIEVLHQNQEVLMY